MPDTPVPLSTAFGENVAMRVASWLMVVASVFPATLWIDQIRNGGEVPDYNAGQLWLLTLTVGIVGFAAGGSGITAFLVGLFLWLGKRGSAEPAPRRISDRLKFISSCATAGMVLASVALGVVFYLGDQYRHEHPGANPSWDSGYFSIVFPRVYCTLVAVWIVTRFVGWVLTPRGIRSTV